MVDVGQAEDEEAPEGAHVDVQLRPGGGPEGVDALPRGRPKVYLHII